MTENAIEVDLAAVGRPCRGRDVAVLAIVREQRPAAAVRFHHGELRHLIDEGFIDYRRFLAGMRESGFTGSVAYEMCSPLDGGASLDNLDRYARRFLEFLNEFRRAGSKRARYRQGTSHSAKALSTIYELVGP